MNVPVPKVDTPFWRAAWVGLVFGLGCVPSTPLEPPRLNPDLVQRGAFLFLDPELSGDGSRSCATCHPGGGSDNLIYQAGKKVAPGSPAGRRTLALRGIWQTPPYLWDGSLPTVRTAVERMLDVEMRGARLDELDVAALEAYVLSIPPFDRGRVETDGTPVEPAILSTRRGFEVFQRAKCSLCHPPPAYARPLRFDVGTGGKFFPPTLLGLPREGPYGHDGRWETLEEAVVAILNARETELREQELQQLLLYLMLL